MDDGGSSADYNIKPKACQLCADSSHGQHHGPLVSLLMQLTRVQERVCLHMYAFVCVCAHISMSVCVYACVLLCLHVCVFMCVHFCVCVCV